MLIRRPFSKPFAKIFVFVFVCASATGNPSATSAPTYIENRRARFRTSSTPTFVGTSRFTAAMTR